MVKKLFIILFFLSFYLATFSQSCMTFQSMDKNGLRMTALDSLHPSVAHAPGTKGVFDSKKEKQFEKAWGDYFSDLMQFIADNDFKWQKPTYCFNKIYFDRDGKVDYWFYNFKKTDSIPQQTQDKYLELITKFSAVNKIKISGNSNFAQCASVTFSDFDKKKK